MTFTICTAPQRSDEWFNARLGRLTGSRAADMLATIKSGEAAARRNLRIQLMIERITGRPAEFTADTPAMQQGVIREPLARQAYSDRTGTEVIESGFLAHTDVLAGCSLDGHVAAPDNTIAGIIEIKCPQPNAHLENLRRRGPSENYHKQIVHNLWISGAPWCDFISWNPDFPEKLQLLIVRITPSEWELSEYEQKALEFLSEVDMEVRLVEGMEGMAA